MLNSLAIAFGIAALLTWLLAVSAALEMIKHRKAGVSVWWFLGNGLAFFTGKNFGAEADAARGRFLRYAGVFALSLIAGMIIGVFGAAMQRT
jgi:hypothetical protein